MICPEHGEVVALTCCRLCMEDEAKDDRHARDMRVAEAMRDKFIKHIEHELAGYSGDNRLLIRWAVVLLDWLRSLDLAAVVEGVE